MLSRYVHKGTSCCESIHETLAGIAALSYRLVAVWSSSLSLAYTSLLFLLLSSLFVLPVSEEFSTKNRQRGSHVLRLCLRSASWIHPRSHILGPI
ncbi:hypothetical protein BU26DRAFT_322851 [Trematosphaeria pertusa]|uniref:Uncharacterized protein n=1 Tax=Trematosphaeria pertusa TaxID=390896 RepID=A0A6A6ICX3_9PLEO|nr:uncharacterized protein BU26DRAFT_322851 [Trematosphaeria pertusa]KAF2247908.1 hypothetical protein BU26DRAFT_322851 [Trematosphaeria pertusa]